MKIAIKIILLLFALVVSIGGTLFFLKTRVTPPQHLTFNNAYVADVEQGINRLSNISNDEETDSAYTAVMHYITFLKDNARINNTEADRLLAQFAKTYVPLYAKRCEEKFAKSVWVESELQAINNHVEEIKELRDSNYISVLTYNERDALQNILSVLSDYQQAKQATNVTFQGFATAKNQTSLAKKWLNTSPINNCTALTEKLKTVAPRLERAHYLNLSSKVTGLLRYGYDANAYFTRYKSVIAELDEYTNEANAVYGTRSDVSSLRAKAENYMMQASAYFRSDDSYLDDYYSDDDY